MFGRAAVIFNFRIQMRSEGSLMEGRHILKGNTTTKPLMATSRVSTKIQTSDIKDENRNVFGIKTVLMYLDRHLQVILNKDYTGSYW